MNPAINKHLKKISELRRICNIAFDKNLLDTHSGNISQGIGKNNLLISKTGRSLIDLKPSDFTIVPLKKSKAGDSSGASSEIEIHRFILSCFPGSTIFHSHPLNSIALTLNMLESNGVNIGKFKDSPLIIKKIYKKYPDLDEIVPLDFESAYFFPKIYVFPLELIEDIKTNSLKTEFKAKDIFKENGVFMIKTHGSFSWGKTPLDALRWTMTLEASSKIISACKNRS